MKNIRQVIFYKPTKTTMDKLSPGDLFSMVPCDRDDSITGCELYRATGKPRHQKDRPKHFQEIDSITISETGVRRKK